MLLSCGFCDAKSMRIASSSIDFAGMQKQLNIRLNCRNILLRHQSGHLPQQMGITYLKHNTAELLQIPGFDHFPTIESGSVIRELEEKIYDRLCTIGPLELACVYHKNSVKA